MQLDGIRVLDLTRILSGPFASMFLADMGAEVIKVEMPGTGDPFRAFKGDLYSPHFQTYNRGKKSVELNTKDAADLAAFDELVKGADVFIQNFRPGVATRMSTAFLEWKAVPDILSRSALMTASLPLAISPPRSMWVKTLSLSP